MESRIEVELERRMIALQAQLRQKDHMLDDIKKKCEEQGALVMNWFGQTTHWRDRYEETKQDRGKELM
eukprot:2632722-Prorocentrum_lima.AAC.1